MAAAVDEFLSRSTVCLSRNFTCIVPDIDVVADPAPTADAGWPSITTDVEGMTDER